MRASVEYIQEVLAVLNDHFRMNPTTEFGETMWTRGVEKYIENCSIEALGGCDELYMVACENDIRRAIANYRFQDDVPKHDRGVVAVDDTLTVAWRIDCYNKKMRRPSKDPTNSDITRRRLTIKRV